MVMVKFMAMMITIMMLLVMAVMIVIVMLIVILKVMVIIMVLQETLEFDRRVLPEYHRQA